MQSMWTRKYNMPMKSYEEWRRKRKVEYETTIATTVRMSPKIQPLMIAQEEEPTKQGENCEANFTPTTALREHMRRHGSTAPG